MAFPTITISGTDMLADYLAMAYHNLGGIEIKIYADAVEISSYTPADGSPFIHLLGGIGAPPVQADEFIIEPQTNEDVQIGDLKLGVLLITERPCKYVGHEPITLAKTAQINPVKAMNGQFLGGRVIKTGSKNTIEIENLTPEWVRSDLQPFMEHAISKPYYQAWRIDDYPNEVGYGWTNDVIVPQNARSNGMMNVSWDFEGVADSDMEQLG